MGLEFDVEAGAQHNGDAKYQQSLPGKLRLSTPLLCWLVRLNQPSPNGPFPQLVGSEPCKSGNIPRPNQLHVPPSMGMMPDLENGYHTRPCSVKLTAVVSQRCGNR
ncbi:hypothetical protein MesoLj113a_71220 [Mesorhizobium sp. 113-1-2]|nr:hypothetical protein MesoLj113a_71220 [Mesorhizobium sp. 113-1-2]